MIEENLLIITYVLQDLQADFVVTRTTNFIHNLNLPVILRGEKPFERESTNQPLNNERSVLYIVSNRQLEGVQLVVVII